jgi:manganese/zinc/iron transport system substrate-binding protein
MKRFLKRRCWIYVAVVCTLFQLGCGNSSTQGKAGTGAASEYKGEYPIQAIGTVGMVADIVRNVAGEHAEVSQIMGAGVDPHLYRATRDEVGRTKPVWAVTEMIEESRLLEPDEMEGHYDPHVWMDVEAWGDCVDAVEKSLVDFDPSHADDYRKNAKKYRKQLADLHEYGLKSVSSIPEGSRVLITSHDAFNYFGRAYGLDVQGVQGISTESEAGLQRINELIDSIVAKKVRAVFVESSVPRKNIDAIVEGARDRGHEIIVGGELFSDAMGETGSYEGTYVGMLDHNLTLVTQALGGKAPLKGLNGKLSMKAGE